VTAKGSCSPQNNFEICENLTSRFKNPQTKFCLFLKFFSSAWKEARFFLFKKRRLKM